MRDCISPPLYSFRVHKLGFPIHLKSHKLENGCGFQSQRIPITLSSCRNRDAVPFPSDKCEDGNLNFGLMEEERSREFQLRSGKSITDNEDKTEKPARSELDGEAKSVGDVFKFRSQNTDDKLAKGALGLDPDFVESDKGAVEVVKSRRTVMRRSNVMAKQVISIRSALCLGYVSQLWVDTSSWIVLFVEVRPNLLSGEFEMFRFENIAQVGDVILIEDDNVIENDFILAGLETLVGYTVLTPNRRSIGKVRGYSFNINSGIVRSLELDSFGIPIIPSNLVSTYGLLVEDVLEVLPDTIIVNESAALRIQRLTKGFWDGQNLGNVTKEFEEQLDLNGQQDHSGYRQGRKASRKLHPNIRKRRRKGIIDWEPPMDYF